LSFEANRNGVFRVKNYVQREVPIPDDFFEELIQWKESHPGQMLIVPNGKGKPHLRLIRDVKRFAYLHGLRCGSAPIAGQAIRIARIGSFTNSAGLTPLL
jgi:hypothetical protein